MVACPAPFHFISTFPNKVLYIPVSQLAAALRQVRGFGADVSTEAGSGQATTWWLVLQLTSRRHCVNGWFKRLPCAFTAKSRGPMCGRPNKKSRRSKDYCHQPASDSFSRTSSSEQRAEFIFFTLLSCKSRYCAVDGKSGFHSSPDCQRGPRTLGPRVPLCLPKLKPFPTYRNDLRMTRLSLRSANATESPPLSKLQNHTYQNVNLWCLWQQCPEAVAPGEKKAPKKKQKTCDDS